jgi:hypothetical protein
MLKYVWVLFILVNGINALIFTRTACRVLVRRPELAPGFRKLLIGQCIVLNIPWVEMRIGCIASDITVFHYFNLQDGNPFVWAWWGCVILLWVVGFVWLFILGGAEFMIEHRDLFGPWAYRVPSSVWLLKLVYVVAVAGGVTALMLAVTGALPVPN